jgi:hypothetical protein
MTPFAVLFATERKCAPVQGSARAREPVSLRVLCYCFCRLLIGPYSSQDTPECR